MTNWKEKMQKESKPPRESIPPLQETDCFDETKKLKQPEKCAVVSVESPWFKVWIDGRRSKQVQKISD